MPGRDKTGPNGQGSMTGRRMGYCAGNSPDIPPNFGGFKQGRGMKAGLGRRFQRGFAPVETENYSQKTDLKAELGSLKVKMEFLESELKKLD